ncbi:hypothetical protein HDU99_001405 [Rhizoclosmatium hyalinum]|nr:hypothetical protein HDU99_001405 [Rhizoclosmatium hyalinum]
MSDDPTSDQPTSSNPFNDQGVNNIIPHVNATTSSPPTATPAPNFNSTFLSPKVHRKKLESTPRNSPDSPAASSSFIMIPALNASPATPNSQGFSTNSLEGNRGYVASPSPSSLLLSPHRTPGRGFLQGLPDSVPSKERDSMTRSNSFRSNIVPGWRRSNQASPRTSPLTAFQPEGQVQNAEQQHGLDSPKAIHVPRSSPFVEPISLKEPTTFAAKRAASMAKQKTAADLPRHLQGLRRSSVQASTSPEEIAPAKLLTQPSFSKILFSAFSTSRSTSVSEPPKPKKRHSSSSDQQTTYIEPQQSFGSRGSSSAAQKRASLKPQEPILENEPMPPPPPSIPSSPPSSSRRSSFSVPLKAPVIVESTLSPPPLARAPTSKSAHSNVLFLDDGRGSDSLRKYKGGLAYASTGQSYVSLRKSQTASQHFEEKEINVGLKYHPIILWMMERQASILQSIWFKRIVDFLASDKTCIFIWFGIVLFMHTVITTIFIISVWLIIPGIWVYNLAQLFVVSSTVIAHLASKKLSSIIQRSITSSDLMRGRITIPEIADYWVHGPLSPAYKVIRTGAIIELISDAIVIISSISFSWADVQTKLITGVCQPPLYINASLPPGIDVPQYVQGDVDYAEVYNYGLPLADGLIGGWPGWPNSNPKDDFWMFGEGPVYIIQLLCDNGTPRPDLSTDLGIATHVSSRLLEKNSRSIMLETDILFPAGSVYDDVRKTLHNTTVLQTCSSLITVSYGTIAYEFHSDQWNMVTNGQHRNIRSQDAGFYAEYPSSIYQYSKDAYNLFEKFPDKYGVLPLFSETVKIVFQNNSYYPSQGAVFCNLLSEGTYPDGYYHTAATYRGMATGIGVAAHFAMMQYTAGITTPCEYMGYTGSGQLKVPQLAIFLSAASSVIACFVKLFEIIWWSFAQTETDAYHAYRRARRLLRHPMRFAMDMAEMLQFGMEAGKKEEDVCDVNTTRAIEELGGGRIHYGEDAVTTECEAGHLRIAEYGKVKSILPDRMYGTMRINDNFEIDELLGGLQLLPTMSAEDRKELNLATCKQLLKRVPFLKREMRDGRDDIFYDMLSGMLIERMYNPGVFIVRQGDEAVEMFFLLSGKVNIIVNDAIVASLKEGNFFGDFRAILDQFEDVKERIHSIHKERMSRVAMERKSEAFETNSLKQSIHRLSALLSKSK